MEWDYKLDPPDSDHEQHLWDKIVDMDQATLIRYAERRKLLPVDFDDGPITLLKVEQLRDHIYEYMLESDIDE